MSTRPDPVSTRPDPVSTRPDPVSTRPDPASTRPDPASAVTPQAAPPDVTQREVMPPEVMPPDVDARDELPERIAARLDAPMTVLGIVFLLSVVAETLVGVGGEHATLFLVLSWGIWGAFVAEFGIRLWAAPSASGYLKRNWWQLLFLLVPFLRFVRLIRLFRVARAGRVLSSAVRSVRTATRTFTGRLGWLLSIHVIVVLAASQLVFEYGGVDSYPDALAATAMSAVAGEPTGGTTTFARIADVALAMYAAIMFAALAGVIAAFLLERRSEATAVAERERSAKA